MYNSSKETNSLASRKVRHLNSEELHALSAMLRLNKSWQSLAAVIRNPDNKEELFYTADDVGIFESMDEPALCLLDDWGTRGVKQPTLHDLQAFLKEAKLLRAANYVELELLQITDNADNEATISSYTIFAPEESNHTLVGQFSQTIPCDPIIEEMLKDVDLSTLVIFPYNELQEVSDGFREVRMDCGGCMIGEGAYGTVFKSNLSGIDVAIKKLKNSFDKQFFTEITTLVRFKHVNLLPLLGFSVDGQKCCLVYEYMANGSLQEGLACSMNSQPISTSKRLSIAHGTALGITFLHTFSEKPMVHRDIKSANILLDADFTPKIGDFGLVRMGSSTISSTSAITENIFGTRMYMPMEAFMGDVSVKLDTYSYGVVLLELLTALPPYDTNRDGFDLITHMENYDDILEKLDPKVIWDTNIALEIHRIARLCLKPEKKNRPTLSEVLPDLVKCCSNKSEKREVSI